MFKPVFAVDADQLAQRCRLTSIPTKQLAQALGMPMPAFIARMKRGLVVTEYEKDRLIELFRRYDPDYETPEK